MPRLSETSTPRAAPCPSRRTPLAHPGRCAKAALHTLSSGNGKVGLKNLRHSLATGIGVVNLLTDVAQVALPGVMMWSVQTAFDIKVRVVTLFSCRLL